MEEVIPAEWLREAGKFMPFARYDSVMDQLVYLDADTSYRSERVDSYLTLFWAPHEFKLVGFKLKGFKALFLTLKTVVDNLKDEDFVPFIKLLELAAFASWSRISVNVDNAKVEKRYEMAKSFVAERRVKMRDLQLEAA